MSDTPARLDTFPAADASDHVSRFDNLHVLLWLIKDSCWMLEWRLLGTLMIVPTIAVAVFLTVRTRAGRVFWINLAICFWIAANSYWMVCEFFGHEDLKNYAGIGFAGGFAAVAAFYLSPAPSAAGPVTEDADAMPNAATKISR